MRLSPHERAGFTLVEMMISASLLAFVLGAATMIALSSASAFSMGHGNMTLEAKVRRTANRLVNEFTSAGRVGLIPDPQPFPPAPGVGTSTLDFRKNVGVVGGVVQWGPLTRIRFEYSPSEIDNGLDDDGNGLIDDGAVVWLENPDTPQERRAVLINGVSEFLQGEIPNGLDDNGNGLIDEQGLSFDMDNNNLIIRLSLERMQTGTQQPIVRSIETSILLRN
jgi:prepilin-type N-terminal cleavage/methylation domain-containing protein